MAETTYSYSISSDMPGGSVNSQKLAEEIETSGSGITIQLERIDVKGDVLDVIFKDALSASEKTTLDNDTTGPAGGLLAAHDNTPSAPATDANIINTPDVRPRPPAEPEGFKRAYSFSFDFTDKTTWWYKSVEVIDEAVGTGDGVETQFNLAGFPVIDLSHGKITDENLMTTRTGDTLTSWIPEIKVDSVVQTEDEPFGGTTHDYSINYDTGQITFSSPPGNGLAITASYFYVDTTLPGHSINEARPPVGRKWTIDKAEVQFSKDVVINDSVMWAAYANPPGIVVPGTDITEYKHFGNYLDFSYGSFPEVPAMGGAQRGLSQPTQILRWEYVASLVIKNSDGVDLRTWLKNDTVFGGERATFTLYILEENE